ncbi:ExeM/NucH family extracellular endonuclease [Xanthomonas sp. XNM01]|uniref:ExeM/NucH family extracellular endonuclease n=1 Tax=Xanthomonas sp. XNM01 TaxID=2769289 RepID=UPI0017815FBC|nr:ExeM/NucH family extracellular endonuclease [Xanthomonas sp. XNM01]MBD9370472.1 ExeM/NucH family extracellular endonuclease [Xanthomonas sp. XNM01]
MPRHSLLSTGLLAALLVAGLPADARQTAHLPIGQIQGGGTRSALEGRQVTVEGVVTADFRSGLQGVYLQDGGDGDPATSDALFVQTGEDLPTAALAVGMRCRIGGRVAELATGRSPTTMTALQDIRIERCTPGQALPAPVVVDALPADWAPLTGMRVQVTAPLTVTATHALRRFGELAVGFDGRQWQPSEIERPGSDAHARLTAENARQRLLLDDASQQRDPATIAWLPDDATPRVGSTVRGAEGIVEHRLGSWRLQLTAPPTITAAARPQPPQVEGKVRVAAFNLENLFNGDGRGGGFPTRRGAKSQADHEAQRAKLVATIHALDPDIAALMELENDGYGPDSALAQLVQALNADGARWRFVDAGEGPGSDDIRVGLIYRADRVRTRGKPATLHGGPFDTRSRVPLAQTFARRGGTPFVVVANHLKSKGCSEAEGADADQRDGQACWNASRLDAVQRLHAWMQEKPLGRASARAVLLGDFNAYAMEDPVRWMREDGGWVDAFAATDGGARPYSYVYDGLSGRLDHALLSPALAPFLRGAAEWHTNADEADEAGYADRNVPGPWRSSDHDPLLIGLDL